MHRRARVEKLRRVARVHRRLIHLWGRRALWVCGVALVVGGGLLTTRRSLAPPLVIAVVETEVVREVPVGSLLSLTVESPRPAAGIEAAPCPPIDVAIDRAAGRRFDPAATQAVVFTHVIASPTRGQLIAAHDGGGQIYASRDDGRSFARVLERPGTLQDLAFGCAGELYALRGNLGALELGVHGAGERWRRLRIGACQTDVEAQMSLAAGAGWLAIAIDHVDCDDEGGRQALWMSPDRGASWRRLAIPAPEMVEGIRVVDLRADRVRIAAYEGDCMYDGTMLYDFDPRTGELLRTQAATRNHQQRSIETRGRWAYAERGCGGVACKASLDAPAGGDSGDGLTWIIAVAALPDAEPTAEPDDRGEPVLVGGPRHLYSFDGRVAWSLSTGRARPLPGRPATGVSYRSVDLAGRMLGVTDAGQIVRWSPIHGSFALGGHLVGERFSAVDKPSPDHYNSLPGGE